MTRILRTQRRVLRIFPFAEEAGAVASSQGWVKTYDVPRDADLSRPREITWQVEPGLGFGYLESYLSKDCCFFGLGEDADASDRMIAGIADEFRADIYGEDELVEAVTTGGSPAQLARAVVRAGLGAPLEYDPEFADPIAAVATNHDEQRVRYVAVHTMLYTEWPQFAPLLRRIVHHDPSDTVRGMAERVLRVFEEA